MDAGTIWRYEKKPAPGENKRRKMTSEMAINLTNDLRAHIEELDSAGLENNLHKLRKEILNAKEYVRTLKSSLAAYHNTTKLEGVIIDVENTIGMSEAQVKRLQKNSSEISRKEG